MRGYGRTLVETVVMQLARLTVAYLDHHMTLFVCSFELIRFCLPPKRIITTVVHSFTGKHRKPSNPYELVDEDVDDPSDAVTPPRRIEYRSISLRPTIHGINERLARGEEVPFDPASFNNPRYNHHELREDHVYDEVQYEQPRGAAAALRRGNMVRAPPFCMRNIIWLIFFCLCRTLILPMRMLLMTMHMTSVMDSHCVII